jgi:hypothetical protein
MKEWIGKKVYFSSSKQYADEYKYSKIEEYSGILESFDVDNELGQQYKVDGNFWEYAVLAEDTFTQGDLVQVCDDGEWDNLEWMDLEPAIFMGTLGDRFLIVEKEDFETLNTYSGFSGVTISSWKYCRLVPPSKKKISKEEALSKLKEVYGEEVEIE